MGRGEQTGILEEEIAGTDLLKLLSFRIQDELRELARWFVETLDAAECPLPGDCESRVQQRFSLSTKSSDSADFENEVFVSNEDQKCMPEGIDEKEDVDIEGKCQSFSSVKSSVGPTPTVSKRLSGGESHEMEHMGIEGNENTKLELSKKSKNEFVRRVRSCMKLAQDLSTQTAVALDAQDAELASLQEKLIRVSEPQRPSHRQTLEDLPPLRGLSIDCPSRAGITAINQELDGLLSRVRDVLNQGKELDRDGRKSSVFDPSIHADLTRIDTWNDGDVPGSFHLDTSRTHYSDELAFKAFESQARRLKEQLNEYGLVGPMSGFRSFSPSYSDTRAESMQEDSKLRICFIEEMQQGSWFFRIGRKYGPIGRAFKSSFCRRAYLWISYDYRILYCAPSEPTAIPLGSNRSTSSNAKKGKGMVIALPLHNVTNFVYGTTSRAYRLQEAKSGQCHPPHLCFSLSTKRQSLDLVALNEGEVERWFFGLSSLVPLFPGRIFFTPEEFNDLKVKMKYESLCKQKTHSRNAEEELSFMEQ